MVSNWLRRVLSPVVQFRESAFATGLMMFAYSLMRSHMSVRSEFAHVF